MPLALPLVYVFDEVTFQVSATAGVATAVTPQTTAVAMLAVDTTDCVDDFDLPCVCANSETTTKALR